MDFCHVQAAAESVDFADYRRGSFPADVVSAGCMAPFDGADIISWSSYTMNYYVWHVMDKYMMSQIEDSDKKEESVFDDDLITK